MDGSWAMGKMFGLGNLSKKQALRCELEGATSGRYGAEEFERFVQKCLTDFPSPATYHGRAKACALWRLRRGGVHKLTDARDPRCRGPLRAASQRPGLGHAKRKAARGRAGPHVRRAGYRG